MITDIVCEAIFPSFAECYLETTEMYRIVYDIKNEALERRSGQLSIRKRRIVYKTEKKRKILLLII